MPGAYSVADYIVDRLAELGVDHMFGVAGNYTATFLNVANGTGRIKVVATTSEAEAGYAADAYARLRGLGAVCVTYGVGALSLLNQVAGAYVEMCPVVVINGSANASKAQQLVQQGVLFAHAIDKLRTDELLFRPIVAATAVVLDAADAPNLIDNLLVTCLMARRPVYLEVRDGVWEQACAHIQEPLAKRLGRGRHSKEVLQSVQRATDAVVKQLRAAQRPVLWGGEGLQRVGAQDAFEELVSATRLPYTTTLLGKSVISEDNPYFVGVYDSIFAPEDTRNIVEGADCLIALGTILTDFYGTIVAKSYDRMILAAGETVRVGHDVYQNVPLELLVPELVARCRFDGVELNAMRQWTPPAGFKAARRSVKHAKYRAETAAMLSTPSSGDAAPPLTWDEVFRLLGSVVDEECVVVVDTSLALFPAAEIQIRGRNRFIAQAAWLSIGYSTPAALGASLALGDRAGRVFALAGDGGFQMTATTLSTLVRCGRPTIVLVFDNGLYGVEQFLTKRTYFQNSHEPPDFFNELRRWNYVQLAEALGCHGVQVRTRAELHSALTAAMAASGVSLISVELSPRDLPAEIKMSLPRSAPESGGAQMSDGATPVRGIATAALN